MSPYAPKQETEEEIFHSMLRAQQDYVPFFIPSLESYAAELNQNFFSSQEDDLHGRAVNLDSMKRAKVTVIEPLRLTE